MKIHFVNYSLDVILPYLESTVDSPIASQCGTNKISGGGDVSVADLLDEVSSSIDTHTNKLLHVLHGKPYAVSQSVIHPGRKNVAA